jgi:hypothetical protein
LQPVGVDPHMSSKNAGHAESLCGLRISIALALPP